MSRYRGRKLMRNKALLLVSISLILFAACFQPASVRGASAGAATTAATWAEREKWEAFEADLETVRQALKIPGMSAAVVQDQELVWARGFGYADLENQVPATPHTPYGLASVTKPVAAVLIMQLVEEGLVDLDAPISDYGVSLASEGVITVRHLLTHTSEGVPGTVHDYNGNRYARLGGVMEGASGRTFARLLGERLVAPLGMEDTALNPINNWYGPSIKGLEDFGRILGRGEGFGPVPDVYARLAQPYQFDEEYEIIEGMYHLHHNPGAGLVSSVTDLAKFDIALDQGRLLNDATREQMLTPAYSTYPGRQDLQYGLGWHVQEFEGLRLLWHTGRWAPSTSALFLKVPEENLTFIVLANTDNLTVPFYGIGHGDISQSTLVLTFFRHFLFPRQHNTTPPAFDWGVEQGAQGELVEQLAAVSNAASRRFLERELWSFRQAYASAGRGDIARRLAWVRRQTFPGSELRHDPFITATAGQPEVIPPVPRAVTFVWVAQGIALWLILVLVSFLWMLVKLVRGKETTLWQKAIWLLAAFILGPIALLVHGLTVRKPHTAPQPAWKGALGAALLSISGYALGWTFAIAVLVSSPSEPHPLLILGLCYLVPLLLGLLLIRAPSLARLGGLGFGRAISRGLLAEIITLNLGFAALFPLTMFVDQYLFSSMPHPTSPFFWGMMSAVSLVGLLVLFPLQYWMARRNMSGVSVGVAVRIPTLRNSWGALLGTCGIMIIALVLTISQLA
jgi:CubicO group peptidase (beta-lactamase class C family)